MLKDSDTARHATRRTHRTYTPAFKAESVAACQQPGTFIAALASSHGVNANVLHRWLKEHALTGCHQPLELQQPSADEPACAAPTFIPLRLPPAIAEHVSPELKVELREGALSITIAWPIHAAAEFARWVAAVLK